MYKINNSPGLLKELEALCKDAGIEPLRMIKPVDKWWNSKSLMISCAIHLKPAIKDICSRNSLTTYYNTHSLRLKQEEWVILKELAPLLGVCTVMFYLILHC